MKKLLIALTLLGAGIASSKADVAFSISFGTYHQTPRYCAPVAPVVVAPVAPVVVAPVRPVYGRPVYAAPVYTTPVYAAPACPQPVYAPVAPVVVAPQPVYYHGYSYGYSQPHHRSYDRASGWAAPRHSAPVFVGW